MMHGVTIYITVATYYDAQYNSIHYSTIYLFEYNRLLSAYMIKQLAHNVTEIYNKLKVYLMIYKQKIIYLKSI
jgi:hypothetical protein